MFVLAWDDCLFCLALTNKGDSETMFRMVEVEEEWDLLEVSNPEDSMSDSKEIE